MSAIHIYVPDFRVRRVVRLCPHCNVRRVHVQEIYEWHDPDYICLTCGQRWTIGWLYPRAGRREMSKHIARAREWLKVKWLRYRGLRFVHSQPELR